MADARRASLSDRIKKLLPQSIRKRLSSRGQFMYVAECTQPNAWQPGRIVPFGPLEILPSAGVLNYGQGVIEGMQARRTLDGRLVSFRPRSHAERMQEGAECLAMPPVPTSQFVDAIRRVILANAETIPSAGEGGLYLRPLLMGSGATAGAGPARSYTFVVYASPRPNSDAREPTPLSLEVSSEHHRAAPGGSGHIKAIGNYGSVLRPKLQAEARGHSGLLYLDAREHRLIEEADHTNIFFVKDAVLLTPALSGNLLPGITRDSVLAIARARGLEVRDEPIDLDCAMNADECFVTGTAAGLIPVASLTHSGATTHYGSGKIGPYCSQLREDLMAILQGLAEDEFDWLMTME